MVLPPGIFARNRGVVTPQYAVMPHEGVLTSNLPGFANTAIRFLTAPAMGARFAQLRLDLAPGGGTTAPRHDDLEHFFYVLGGAVALTIGTAQHHLAHEGYAYVPADQPYALTNTGRETASLIWIKRPYEAIDLPSPTPVVGRRDAIARTTSHTAGRYWQYLLPRNDLAFDFEMNILGFAPGNYFPYVETHIMEHGLYMLEGQGLYLLSGDQHEVWTDDFIWMGPFCPQFFFCTGWGEAAYLLYKDVNRDVRFT